VDADLIRLVLLILGVALVAGIWLWDHWQRRKGEPPMAHREDEPRSELEPEPEHIPRWEESDTAIEAPVEEPPAEQPQEEQPQAEQPAEAEPTPFVPPEMEEADEPLPTVEHSPAWVRPEEPAIPAFLMNAESEPRAEEHAASAETEASSPAEAVETEGEPEPLPQETAEPELPATEPLLVADTEAEPEIPVLELEAEPIHAPARPAHTKSRETAPKPKPKPEAEPVSIRPDDEQFDLDLGFSAVDEQDLEELAAELPQLIVQINIVARAGLFSGEQILAAMEQVEMQAGEHNIFHRRDNRGRGGKPKVLFSLASMVEPGSFPLKKMKDFTTPGLTLFTQLPGPRDGLLVYSDMLYVAERLARLLDARLKDEQRSTLTKQTIEHTRERIAEHKRQITLKLRQAGDQHRGRR
jgi:cell division protein ZipA